MKHILIGAAAFMVVVGPVWAQAPYSGSSQPPRAPAAVADPSGWRSSAATPEDAYKQGLINRWQLEQIEGPLPQAFQGPSPDGSKGGDGGFSQ